MLLVVLLCLAIQGVLAQDASTFGPKGAQAEPYGVAPGIVHVIFGAAGQLFCRRHAAQTFRERIRCRRRRRRLQSRRRCASS